MTAINHDAIELRASLALDVVAASQSILEGDIDEARFRANLLWRHARDMDLNDIMVAAACVVARLGPPGTRPVAGVGAAMLKLCRTIEITA